jgi:hypothetical protein
MATGPTGMVRTGTVACDPPAAGCRSARLPTAVPESAVMKGVNFTARLG